jgi:hypothetical protein
MVVALQDVLLEGDAKAAANGRADRTTAGDRDDEELATKSERAQRARRGIAVVRSCSMERPDAEYECDVPSPWPAWPVAMAGGRPKHGEQDGRDIEGATDRPEAGVGTHDSLDLQWPLYSLHVVLALALLCLLLLGKSEVRPQTQTPQRQLPVVHVLHVLVVQCGSQYDYCRSTCTCTGTCGVALCRPIYSSKRK